MSRIASGPLLSVVDSESGDGGVASHQKADIRNPAQRAAMLRRMTAIINDERVSAETRAKAARMVSHLTALEQPRREVRGKGRRVFNVPKISTYFGPAIASVVWCTIFAVRAHLASARVLECDDMLSGAQRDLCIRHAIEGRDDAVIFALAGPVLIIIAIVLYRQFRSRPEQ